MTWPPPPDELKETFLLALHEPLRTTLTIVGFTGKTLEEVIDHVLRLHNAQTNDNMSITALQRACQRMTNNVSDRQSNAQPTSTPVIR